MSMDYESFKPAFEWISGVNLDFYKEKQMKRRIETFIARRGFTNYLDFFEQLEADSTLYSAFINYITINVTEFFRTPEQWAVFENEVLANLVENTPGQLKIWSCAASTGEEPYSLAMSLARRTDLERVRIIATDIDATALAKAKEGVYDETTAKGLTPAAIEDFFIKTSKGLQVNAEIKACVEFSKLDMLKDAHPDACDLIVCRNVLIYFTEQAKEYVYNAFKEDLKPGGYLFTGNTEQIINSKRLGYTKIRNFIYKNE